LNAGELLRDMACFISKKLSAALYNMHEALSSVVALFYYKEFLFLDKLFKLGSLELTSEF